MLNKYSSLIIFIPNPRVKMILSAAFQP